MKRQVRVPFLIVNPKAYIYGNESLELAKVCDALSEEYDIDIIFTAQHVDIRMIAEATKNIVLTAQHMDGIVAGRGMGHILPEGVKAAGAQAVVLNHAEHALKLDELDRAMKRANELDLFTIVCCDSPEAAKAVATLGPDMMICEPTSGIGTGSISSDDYIHATNDAVKSVSKDILILQAAGVSTGDDVYKVVMEGAHGSGGTSGILNAPDRKAKIVEMLDALKRAEKDLGIK
ncbi:MAG: triose-phosphate isomerase [Clostridia bacterium]|nr:triose-phosphate isomerase [Clostridia bacterium]